MILTDTDIEEEVIEFPETDAVPSVAHRCNGHIINYFDLENKPQSIFIGIRYLDDALERFEDSIENNGIHNHEPGFLPHED